jgi:uncharacterized iron-regulated membrane protein
VLSLPWYVRALEVSRPVHFGNYGGVPLKVLWAFLDVVTIIVLSTGIYLWMIKLRAVRIRAKATLLDASTVLQQ